MGPMHGYGLARRIEQTSGDALKLNQGTLYPALVRLEQQGWIRAKWGASDNNRKAKYYSLTPRGARRLKAESARWSRISALMARFLSPPEAARERPAPLARADRGVAALRRRRA
jgi:transcriptional regulator